MKKQQDNHDHGSPFNHHVDENGDVHLEYKKAPQNNSNNIDWPRRLHEWYLEATARLHPESYNPNAQKPYDEMTDEQKFIDKYIADKFTAKLKEAEIQGRINELKDNQNQTGYDVGRVEMPALEVAERIEELEAALKVSKEK